MSSGPCKTENSLILALLSTVFFMEKSEIDMTPRKTLESSARLLSFEKRGILESLSRIFLLWRKQA